MTDLDKFRTDYEAWQAERERLNALETDPTGPPSANQWEWSDDSAVELLHRAADLLGASPSLSHSVLRSTP